MKAREKAMVGQDTRSRSEEVLQGWQKKSRNELQSERRDAEVVRQGLWKDRGNLKASALNSVDPTR